MGRLTLVFRGSKDPRFLTQFRFFKHREKENIEALGAIPANNGRSRDLVV
jgi:hypothetical protein